MKRTSPPKTKKHIQECAVQLFKQYGFDRVTIQQICECAGISKRTLYYHFTSKDEILLDHRSYLGRKGESIVDSMADSQSYTESLWILMNTFTSYQEEGGLHVARQIYIHVLQGEDESEALYPQNTYLYNTIVRTIGNAQKAGEIQNLSPPAELADALQNLLRGVLFTWISGNGSFDLTERFRKTFDTLLQPIAQK